jgi:hypothetical protein
MPLTLRKLHALFAAEAGAIDLRGAMDACAVLVFRDQRFDGGEQLAFARGFDGTLHAKTGAC